MNKFLCLGLALVAVSGCTRSAPAPVELRGPGYGQTRPGMSGSAYGSANAPVTMDNVAAPSGYAAPANSDIQTQSLDEPNDPYRQAAQQQPSSFVAPPAVTGAQPSPIVSDTSASMGATPLALGGAANTPSAPLEPVALPSASAADLGSGQFGWPLRGKLLSGYGSKSDGQANDGLNIEAPLGTSVYAAKDGTVAYAGNELQSFGNMVLVRHDNGFFTVYAHLDQVLVNKDQPLTRGQAVGTVGQSGGVSKPQLHFEIRRGSTPQDPTKYLGS